MDFRSLCQKIDVDSLKAKLPQMPAMPQLRLPKAMPKLRARKIFRTSREDVSGKSSPKQQQFQRSSSQPPAAPPPPHGPPPPIPRSQFVKHTPTRISTIASLMDQGDDEGDMDDDTGVYNRRPTTNTTNKSNTYRSACSIDDDYPTPRQFDRFASRPISPVQAAYQSSSPREGMASGSASAPTTKRSLSERMQKGYKDITEFRLKHLFAKKTVVRRDAIVVDSYVHSFEEERRREERQQEQRDRRIADNYRFRFKESRQKSGETNSLSSPEHTPLAAGGRRMGRSLSELSGDESGMETSPPPRKPGIASTRFAKVRNPPLRQMTRDEDEDEAEEMRAVTKEQQTSNEQTSTPRRANPSSLWSIKENRTPVEASPSLASGKEKKAGQDSQKKRNYMQRLTSMGSSYESAAESPGEWNTTRGKVFTKLRNMGKRGEEEAAKDTAVEEKAHGEKSSVKLAGEKSMAAIKQNIKRIQKSIKRPQEGGGGDSEEEENKPGKTQTKTEKLAARLRRFKSHDDIAGEVGAKKSSNEYGEETNAPKSPLHAVISTKIQAAWKKSFKKRSPEHGGASSGDTKAHTDDETSPEKRRRSDTLIKKLKYIRSRKTNDSMEVEVEDETMPKKTTTNLEEKFVQARQRTLKKVNETMQHMKFFQKSQEQLDQPNQEKNEEEVVTQTKPKRPKRPKAPPTKKAQPRYTDADCCDESDLDIDMEEIQQQLSSSSQNARTSWTTRSLLSESAESSTEPDIGDFPRVLIHQDNSDAYESTLIIAVTRASSSSRSKATTPIITEIPNDQAEDRSEDVAWVTNNEIITGFLAMEPPVTLMERRLSAVEHQATANLTRRLSDSNIKVTEINEDNKAEGRPFDTVENLSSIGSWKMQPATDSLYKTKSIDIFEKNARTGGVSGAFVDFDDELKNTPVVKIAGDDSDVYEKDSSEDPDGPDDDNSSRITKILANTDITPERLPSMMAPGPMKTTSEDSIAVNYDETEPIYEEEDSDDGDQDDVDRPPSSAPSPPPAISPPPPPLPLRKATILLAAKKSDEAELPPLPRSRPPPLPTTQAQPPTIPARTPSMNRIAKPLVKTSSLRLAYSEQVNPSDVGKVNKLISRFETPTTTTARRPRLIPRNRQQYEADDYTEDEEDDYDDDEDNDNDDDDGDGDGDDDGDNGNRQLQRDMTPTPTNNQKIREDEKTKTTIIVASQKGSTNPIVERQSPSPVKPTKTNPTAKNNNDIRASSKLSLNFDRNSNCSLPNSEYGSPLEYPSSLMGSTETTPIPERRADNLLAGRNSSSRSRRSMTMEQRHEERFLSFDSDEENSYYSISSTGSSRYVVEI